MVAHTHSFSMTFRDCSYYTRVEQASRALEGERMAACAGQEGGGGVMDIEDMVKFGREHKVRDCAESRPADPVLSTCTSRLHLRHVSIYTAALRALNISTSISRLHS